MTIRNSNRFIAPGKLVLIGEYAVLEGSHGMVMAVDRHACVARSNCIRGTRDNLVSIARKAGARALAAGETNGEYQADSSAFYHRGVKLGLGSSAAVTASAVASIYHEHGLDIESDAVRQEIWKAAYVAHNDFQGVVGSGIDLAASIFGNIIVFKRDHAEGAPELLKGEMPRRFKQVFLWTGQPSPTPLLLSAVSRYKRLDPSGYTQITSEMSALSDQFIGECAGDNGELLRIIERYASLMDRLGTLSSSPIVTEAMRSAFRAVKEAGGAAKPSGAGGGDFIVAIIPRDADLRPLLRQMVSLGMSPMRLGLDRRGVHA